jgi:hypothetical protein
VLMASQFHEQLGFTLQCPKSSQLSYRSILALEDDAFDAVHHSPLQHQNIKLQTCHNSVTVFEAGNIYRKCQLNGNGRPFNNTIIDNEHLLIVGRDGSRDRK